VHTAFLLAAAACLSGSLPGLDGWDDGPPFDPTVSLCSGWYFDPSVTPCSGYYPSPWGPGYCGGGYGGPMGYGGCSGPGYAWGCFNDFGWGQGCGYNPWSGYGCDWYAQRNRGCCGKMRTHFHRRCEDDAPPCWGWNPGPGAGPCFGGGCGFTENCGWGSVLDASRASGVWCPNDCHKREGCLHRFCEKHSHRRCDVPPPCFEPGGCPWDTVCDCDCFDGSCAPGLGAPPLLPDQAKPAKK
jgi:hypothetical protein